MDTSERVSRLSSYIFATLNQMAAKKREQGVDVIDLSIGSPDQQPPKHILDALTQALYDTNLPVHRYSAFAGIPEFRTAIAEWYKKRFNVTVDPETEVLPVLGSKDGLSKFFLTYLNKDDVVVIPSPGYPAYRGAVSIASGIPYEIPILEENNFLPVLGSIPPEILTKTKIIVVNYPSNPTAGIETLEFYQQLLEFAKQHNIIVASDIAYSELSFDPGYVPMSFLELPDAKSHAVEFHSFSKTYCMAGWRLGFMVGNSTIIQNVLKLKTHTEYGIFMAVQYAGIAALNSPKEAIQKIVDTYRRRRDIIVNGLNQIGWNVRKPLATMYVWFRIPKQFTTSMDFCQHLLELTGVVVSPGNGFGKYGEGFVRISLVEEEDRLRECIDRIKRNI